MAVSPDATKAGMTDEQWNALTEEQRVEKRRAFAAVPGQPVQPAQPAQPVPVRPVPASAPGTVQAPVRPAVAPAAAPAARPQTEAQRAGMTDAQWNALSEDQKITRRAQFRDPAFRTDAQRAGMTASQWNRLTPAEQASYRLQFPDTTPVPVTTPSPPDPYGSSLNRGGSPLLQEQAATAPPLTEAERVALAKRDPNLPDPGDSLEHLPNAPAGRNNPTMTNYDPSRPPTE